MNKTLFYLTLLTLGVTLISCKPDTLNHLELAELELSNDELLPYLDEFVDIGLDNGHDYTYVYDQPITMAFTGDFKFGHNGQSWGINDKNIEIYINAKWYKRQKQRLGTIDGDNYTKYIIFHELAHDILNLKHKHSTPLMKTDSDWERVENGTYPVVIEAMSYARENGRNSAKSDTATGVIDCIF